MHVQHALRHCFALTLFAGTLVSSFKTRGCLALLKLGNHKSWRRWCKLICPRWRGGYSFPNRKYWQWWKARSTIEHPGGPLACDALPSYSRCFSTAFRECRSRGTSVWQWAKRFPRSEPPCHWRKCAAWWWSLYTFCCNSVSPPCYSILLLWSIPLHHLQAPKGAHGCISVVLFSLCMNENPRSVLKVLFWWWIHLWFQKRSQVIRSPPNPNGFGSCIGRVYELW